MKSLFVGALIAASVSATAAAGATYRLSGIEVRQPWSRPAAAGTTGVGYMTVVNSRSTPDVLTEVVTPAAKKVEIHSSSMAGGVMRMTRQARAPLPAKGQIVFGPGGYHLMLVGLNRALKPGDQIPAMLTFASGVHLKVDFAVGSGLGPPAETSMKDMPGMEHMSH